MKRFLLLLIAVLFPLVVFSQNGSEEKFKETAKPYVEQWLRADTKAVDEKAQELPVFINQYLYFKAFEHGFCVFLGILMLLLPIYFNKLWWLEEEPDAPFEYVEKNGKYKHFMLHLVLPVVLYVIGSALFCFNLSPLIKILFFKKLYIIEKVVGVI